LSIKSNYSGRLDYKMDDQNRVTPGRFTRSLADILRSTLQKLEQTPDFRQEDPAVIELKRHIVRAIAELEISKSAQADMEYGKQPALVGQEHEKTS